MCPMDGGADDFRARAYGLVVGVEDFADPEYSKRPLPHAVSDAEGLADTLTHRLGWDLDHIKLLTGSVTKEDIKEAFSRLRNEAASSPPARLFLFYLSTHGQPFRDQEKIDTVLLASDTRLADTYAIFESGLTRHFVGVYVGNFPAQQRVVIVDACYSASAASASDIAPQGFYREVDAAVPASSLRAAYALPQDQYSVFTACLLDGLQRSDGAVLVRTLSDTVSECVAKRMARDPERSQDVIAETRGGRIVLGYAGKPRAPVAPISYAEVLDFCRKQCEWLLAQTPRHGYDATRYVTRRGAEDLFVKFLDSQPIRPAFTLVGAAGRGKTTVSLRLADLASRKGYAVVWLSPTQVEVGAGASHLLTQGFREFGKGLPLPQLRQLFQDRQPLLLFLDAINEWAGEPEAVVPLCHEVLQLCQENNVRLVVTCRDQPWPNLGKPFGPQVTFSTAKEPSTPIISAEVGPLDDLELSAVRNLYPIAEAVQAGELGRRPLLIRMLSDLEGQGVHREEEVTFVSIFASYVNSGLQRIARRLSTSSEKVSLVVDNLVNTMCERRAESLKSDNLLALASEPIAVALLDEGLFRRIGPEVTVEAELIHEYLLSRILPQDPFLDLRRFEELSDGYPLAYGAAVFRLCEFASVRRVQEILETLRRRRHWYILWEALPRLPDLGPYRNTYLELFAENGELFEHGIWDQLRHAVDSQFEFCMEAARLLFTEQEDIDWESKRWWGMGFDEFASTVAGGWGSDSPVLLLNSLRRNPRLAFKTLVSNWLADRRKLRGGVVNISEVAGVFLRAVGQRFPEEALSAIEDYVHSASAGEQIQTTVSSLAESTPDAALSFAEHWLTQSRLQYLATLILGRLPTAYGARAIGLVRHFLANPETTPDQAVWAITVLGHFRSREVLDFVSEVIERPEYRSGALEALRSLYADFAQEAEQLLNRSLQDAVLPMTDLAAAVKIYADVGEHSREAALEFFRQVLGGHHGTVNQEIRQQIASAIFYWPADDQTKRLVEQQLASEQDGLALRRYGEWIAQKVRKLGPADLPWLHRIVAARQGSDLVRPILSSEITIEAQVQLFVDMELQGSHYFVDGIPREEILRLTKGLLDHPGFSAFRPIAQCWFRRIAAGEEPDQALKDCVEESLRGS